MIPLLDTDNWSIETNQIKQVSESTVLTRPSLQSVLLVRGAQTFSYRNRRSQAPTDFYFYLFENYKNQSYTEIYTQEHKEEVQILKASTEAARIRVTKVARFCQNSAKCSGSVCV
jgi:hypothetical protein